MKVQLKKLKNQNQIQVQKKPWNSKTYLRERYKDFVFETWSFKDQLRTCKCGHIHSEGKCGYPHKTNDYGTKCDCLEFRYCVVELKVIIYEKIGELNEYKGTIF